MFQKDLQLVELVNLEEWQKIQDLFSEVLEVSLRTISVDSNALTRASRPNRLCGRSTTPGSSNLSDFCEKCVLNKGKKFVLSIKEETKVDCPFGLNLFIIPIMAAGSGVAAYMLLGPLILKARKNKSEHIKEARKLNMNKEEFEDALIEINVFSYNKAYSIINLIKNVFSDLAQTGYHKKRLGEIAPRVAEIDPLFGKYYEEKILAALLHACALVLDADSGSVMTVDRNTNLLHIKVASQLDKEVIQNTNIKMGEGIAGLAAKTAKPIILPKDGKKKGLSGKIKMKRNYIKSSMIVPFNAGKSHDVYGVINLNIMRKNADFSDKDIKVVKELVSLAGVALIPFRQPSAKH